LVQEFGNQYSLKLQNRVCSPGKIDGAIIQHLQEVDLDLPGGEIRERNGHGQLMKTMDTSVKILLVCSANMLG
jgi:hypothetical protein